MRKSAEMRRRSGRRWLEARTATARMVGRPNSVRGWTVNEITSTPWLCFSRAIRYVRLRLLRSACIAAARICIYSRRARHQRRLAGLQLVADRDGSRSIVLIIFSQSNLIFILYYYIFSLKLYKIRVRSYWSPVLKLKTVYHP
jgi:hypothetical protein